MTNSDEQLVRRIQQGDEDAWASFLERYSDLILSTSRDYCRLASARTGTGDIRDERDEMYLFLAQMVRRSLRSFRLTCHPRTWIISVIGNRKRVLKAYLMHKAPSRSDVRLPKVMEGRSEIEREIFKRLIWGIEPVHISLDLHVEEFQCLEVEALLAESSPRVYERILSNRRAAEPTVSIDDLDAATGGRPKVQIADTGPGPAEDLDTRVLQEAVGEALSTALERLSAVERRVLILLCNHGMSASDIVEVAASDVRLALSEIDNVNRCYYIKDRALEKVADAVIEKLEQLTGERRLDSEPRQLLKRIEELLQERGFPLKERLT